MKTPNPDHPIRNTLKHFALALTMGAAMYFGAAPANATPVTDGLALWLDASDASTMTLDGSTVNEWRDKNGSAAKMTRDNGAPTVEASGIGGFPTVHFTSGSSMGDGVNHAAPVTIFYVSRQTGGDTGRVLSGGNNWLLGYWGGSRGSAYFEGDVLLGGNGASDTSPHLYATTIGGSGQDSTVWAEGFQIASNQGGTDGPNGLFVGGGGAYSEYSDCDISEVLVYNRILSATELEAVGGYLAAKYGLTTNYPTTPQATIATFGLPGMPATINQTDKTISWPVTYESDPASLAAEFTISVGATAYSTDPALPSPVVITSGTVRDFTNPVDYWVKSSDDSITNKYTVTVIDTPISSAKDITSFSYLGIPGTIDGLNITQNVPFGTPLADIAPDYTVSQYFGDSATGSPLSGNAPSPSFAVQNPATYTVTAQDGSTQDYSVQINVLPEMPTLVNVNYAGPAGTGGDMDGIYSFVPTASGGASRAAPSTYGGNTWNDYRSPTASGSNLLDSKGVTTSVGLTTSLEWAGQWADWTGLGGNRMLISGGGAGYTTFKPIFTLSGLDTDHAYDLYIASRLNNDNHPTDFAIGGTTKHLENAGATDWAEGDSYVYFANVIPQPDGTLGVNAKGTGAWNGVTVNGFQLQDMGERGLNPEALIYTFNSLAGAGPVTMAGTDISMVMAVGSNVSALVPTFTMSPAAVCTLATVDGTPIVSGTTEVDFTDPVHFIVKSEDGSTTTDYTVTVNLVAPSGKVYLNNDNTLRTGLVGPAGGLGETWNQRSLSSESGLLDSVGVPTTVGFTCSGTGGWGLGESANFDPTLWMLKQGFANFTAADTTQQLVITGLDSAKTYDLYIASAILITTNQRSHGEWFTSNVTSTVGNQVCDNRLDQNSSTWVRGNNYVLFEDLEPDGSGNITVDGFAIPEQPTYDVRLTLNGFQLVESAPVTGGFGTWADANNATGQTPDQDHDNDGVENGIEYFMGQTGSSFTAMPGLDGTNTITWTKDPAYSGTYEVQTSPDLVNWTNVVPKPVPTGGSLSYTLPTGAGKQFLRLLVTPAP